MVRNTRRERTPDSDPSPEEIRRQAEDIRRGWTPHELNRRCHYKPVAWKPPLFAATELPVLDDSPSVG